MSRPLIATKYCKTLLTSGSATFTPAYAARFFDKLLYEFWGFCVNQGVGPWAWDPFPVPPAEEDVALPERDITSYRKAYSSQRLIPQRIRLVKR
jgi:hypothetical protein